MLVDLHPLATQRAGSAPSKLNATAAARARLRAVKRSPPSVLPRPQPPAPGELTSTSWNAWLMTAVQGWPQAGGGAEKGGRGGLGGGLGGSGVPAGRVWSGRRQGGQFGRALVHAEISGTVSTRAPAECLPRRGPLAQAGPRARSCRAWVGEHEQVAAVGPRAVLGGQGGALAGVGSRAGRLAAVLGAAHGEARVLAHLVGEAPLALLLRHAPVLRSWAGGADWGARSGGAGAGTTASGGSGNSGSSSGGSGGGSSGSSSGIGSSRGGAPFSINSGGSGGSSGSSGCDGGSSGNTPTMFTRLASQYLRTRGRRGRVSVLQGGRLPGHSSGRLKMRCLIKHPYCGSMMPAPAN